MADTTNRQGFYFNMQACIGCHTCQISCKDKNDLEVGTLFREALSFEQGDYPNTRVYHLGLGCNHCVNAACVNVCPTGAMYYDEDDGTVQHDDDKCIGCKSCVMACPYGQPKFIESTGTVHKCDACKPLRDEGEEPACVASCVMRALEFGPYDDLVAKHPHAVRDITVLPTSSATDPSFLIDTRDAALKPDFHRLTM